nr:uncharacterized protein LOC117278389 [Nicotiana tomentosiformis]
MAFLASKQHNGAQRYNSDKKNFAEGKKVAQVCSYFMNQNHTIKNCYSLIGFPADFKFTKTKRFVSGAKRQSSSACRNSSKSISQFRRNAYDSRPVSVFINYFKMSKLAIKESSPMMKQFLLIAMTLQ